MYQNVDSNSYKWRSMYDFYFVCVCVLSVFQNFDEDVLLHKKIFKNVFHLNIGKF